MNIHEHQAKQILKKYGANVPEGVFAFNVSDLLLKTKELKNRLKIVILRIEFTALKNLNCHH